MSQLRHRVGDRIQNRYEIQKILGSGAFGTVYACLDREIDVPVAIKELHVLDEETTPQINEREAALKQFRAEATHLSRLRHPHIVSGHYQPHSGKWNVCPVCGLDFRPDVRCPEHGAALREVGSRHYLVMETVAGPDLFQLLEKRGPVPLERLERYAKQVAGALAHIHARGLVHRDIKPENIRLRAETDEAVLLDFGIATQGEVAGDSYGTRAQRHTQGGGTVGYAPESPHERRHPDARSDIHAWGMTWAHLLTGLDPTEPDDLRRLRSHTITSFRPEIGDAWSDLVADCIHSDPTQRPQNGGELLERLEALSEKPQPVVVSSQSQTLGGQTQSQTMSQRSSSSTAPPLDWDDGHYSRNVPELVWMLDHAPREAQRKLFAGEIESWLGAIGETELSRIAQMIRLNRAQHPAQGLEELVQATGMVPKPQIAVGADKLDFGTLAQGKARTLDLRVENTGRGLLFGAVRSSHGAVSTPGFWEGNRARLRLTFDGHKLKPGRYDGQIELDGSAGRLYVPFSALVRATGWYIPFLLVFGLGLWGAATGFLLRSLPFYAQPRPGVGWLNQTSSLSWAPAAPIFAATLWGMLALAVTILAGWKRSCAMWTGLGTFATLVALGAFSMGQELLISGDVRLRPIFGASLGPLASGAWMIAGGFLGSLAGMLLAPRALLSVRFFDQLLGALLVGALLWCAMRGALNLPILP